MAHSPPQSRLFRLLVPALRVSLTPIAIAVTSRNRLPPPPLHCHWAKFEVGGHPRSTTRRPPASSGCDRGLSTSLARLSASRSAIPSASLNASPSAGALIRQVSVVATELFRCPP